MTGERDDRKPLSDQGLVSADQPAGPAVRPQWATRKANWFRPRLLADTLELEDWSPTSNIRASHELLQTHLDNLHRASSPEDPLTDPEACENLASCLSDLLLATGGYLVHPGCGLPVTVVCAAEDPRLFALVWQPGPHQLASPFTFHFPAAHVKSEDQPPRPLLLKCISALQTASEYLASAKRASASVEMERETGRAPSAADHIVDDRDADALANVFDQLETECGSLLVKTRRLSDQVVERFKTPKAKHLFTEHFAALLSNLGFAIQSPDGTAAAWLRFNEDDGGFFLLWYDVETKSFQRTEPAPELPALKLLKLSPPDPDTFDPDYPSVFAGFAADRGPLLREALQRYLAGFHRYMHDECGGRWKTPDESVAFTKALNFTLGRLGVGLVEPSTGRRAYLACNRTGTTGQFQFRVYNPETKQTEPGESSVWLPELRLGPPPPPSDKS